MKEEFDKILNRIDELNALDFRGQLNLIKTLKELALNDRNKFNEVIYKSEDKKFRKLIYLCIYSKGKENLKDDKGKPVGIGLFYSKLSDEKKKEFIECANKVLEIFGEVNR